MYFNVDVDLDIDDVYGEMSLSDIKRLMKMLRSDGYITGSDIDGELVNNPLDALYVEAISKLAKSRHLLTIEQEELIIKLAQSL